MPSRSQHFARHTLSLFSLLPATLTFLAFPHLAAASAAQCKIVYPWNNGPFSTNSYGAIRTTWSFNDCANMSWISSPSTPFQQLHLECNEGPNGTAPPWTRVWSVNSTASSGNGSSLFCVANCNPSPPSSNSCRFVLDVGPNAAASPVDTVYSPDVSLGIMDKKSDKGTIYPLPQWTATATTTSLTTMTSISTGTLGIATTAVPSSSSTHTDTLSTGAQVGIGVGVGVIGLIFLAFLGILLRRRRQSRTTKGAPDPIDGKVYWPHATPTYATQDAKSTVSSQVILHELDGAGEPTELPADPRS
ncbi:hypothetical protein K4F52_003951 [Lecanicillium sp. MT-2017a]|nr:hypothetical protein K4F52_003951 [Lecanicillium sp. MT-2017a]